MFLKARYVPGFLLLWFVATVWAEVAVPQLSAHVTDLTATLSAEQVAALESKLTAFEAKKGSQIAVLILPTTEPEDIAAFGIRVAEAWKIGRKNVDDGLILIVAKNDRKLRLEVGRGLEGVIPDAIAKRVLADTIKPHFKNDDYAGGIDAGVAQLMGLIEGEKLPEVSNQSTWTSDDTEFLLMFFWAVVAVLIIFAVISNIGCWFGRGGGGSWSSGSGGSWDSSDSGGSSDSGFSGGGGDFGGGGASDSW